MAKVEAYTYAAVIAEKQKVDLVIWDGRTSFETPLSVKQAKSLLKSLEESLQFIKENK